MRLDSSLESLAGLAANRSGSVADLAEEAPTSRRALHRHSYGGPADGDLTTPTKPFGLGKIYLLIICEYVILVYGF